MSGRGAKFMVKTKMLQNLSNDAAYLTLSVHLFVVFNL